MMGVITSSRTIKGAPFSLKSALELPSRSISGMQEWQLDIGSAPCGTGRPLWISPEIASGSAVNKKCVELLDESTIKSLRASSARCAAQLLSASLERATGSLPEAHSPTNMFGKMTLPSSEPDLNSEPKLCGATSPLTGMPSAPPPSPEILLPSRVISSFVIILPFRGEIFLILEYLRTILYQLRSCVPAMSTGVVQVLARVDVPGRKREWTLTLRIQGLSGGVDTEIRNTLLSMSFVVLSTLPTSCGGSTGIRYLLRLKGEADLFEQRSFGLHPMWIPAYGIPK